MAEQKSRLVLEIDSRDAEQKAEDVRKALGALEDAGIRVKPAMDKAGAGIDGVGKTATKAGESLGQLGKSADGSAKSTASSSESYAAASTRLLAMATNSLQASDYVKALSASTTSASVSFDAASDKIRSITSLSARFRAESDALAGSTDKASVSTRNASAATDLQAKELGELLGKINPAVAALGRLDDMQSKLGQFRKAGLIDAETFKDYSTRLDSTRQGLSAFDEGLSKTGVSARQTESALRQLPMQFTDIFTSLAAGQNPLLVLLQQGGQIKDSFGGVNNTFDALKTKFSSVFSGGAGVASLGSSLAGVAESSKDVAKSAGAAGDGLSDLAESSNTAAEAAENAQKAASALDEVVSRSPTNYLAAIAGLTPFAVSVGVLGAAALQGIRDVNEFNKALVSTGGFAGKTAAQLIDLTNQLANGENFNDARDAILALVKSGRLTGDTFDAVAAAATEMAAATGDSAADIVRKFQDARSDVAGLAADLSSSNHSVTASVYEQVAALQNQGESMEALRILSVSVAGEMKRRNDEISESTRGIAKLWDDATSALGRYWNQLKSGVAADKDSFRLQVLRQQVEDIDGGSWFSNKARDSLKKQYTDEIAQIETRLKAKDEERKAVQEALDDNDKYIASSKKLNDQLDNASPAKKRAAAIRALNSEYLGLLASAERLGKSSSLLEGVSYDGKSFSGGSYDQLLKTINDNSKDPKTPKGKAYTEDAGQKALNAARQTQAVLIQQNASLSAQGVATEKVGAQAQALIRWEQQLSDIKNKKTLTADQESLLASQDLITAQLKKNAGLEREAEIIKGIQQAQKDQVQLLTLTGQLRAANSLKSSLDDAAQMAEYERQGNTEAAKRLETMIKIRDINLQSMQKPGTVEGVTQAPTAPGLDASVGGASSEIDRLAESASKLDEWRATELAKQKEYLDLKAISEETYAARVANIDQQAQNNRIKIEQAKNQALLVGASDFFGNMSALSQSENKKLAAIGKAAAITQATMDGYLAVQKALAAFPPPFNFIAAAAVGVATAANVANIAGIGFSQGGYTGPGGVNEYAGDVHKGEVVWSQADISRFGGVAAVESLRKGNVAPIGAARSGSASRIASSPGTIKQNVNIHNYGSDKVETRQNANGDLDVIINGVRDTLAHEMAGGYGSFVDAGESAYGWRRQGR